MPSFPIRLFGWAVAPVRVSIRKGGRAALQLPAIYEWAEMADEGGLLAYGPRLPLIYRQVARSAAKLLRGAKPADVPLEQPTRTNSPF